MNEVSWGCVSYQYLESSFNKIASHFVAAALTRTYTHFTLPVEYQTWQVGRVCEFGWIHNVQLSLIHMLH